MPAPERSRASTLSCTSAPIPSVPRSVAAPMPSHAANATGTAQILEAARAAGVPQVIVAGSSSVYGSNPGLPKSEFDWTRPMSPWRRSWRPKQYTIAYNYSYSENYFRFFERLRPGPGRRARGYAAVIPQFVDAALGGRPVPIHGDGTQSRDHLCRHGLRRAA